MSATWKDSENMIIGGNRSVLAFRITYYLRYRNPHSSGCDHGTLHYIFGKIVYAKSEHPDQAARAIRSLFTQRLLNLLNQYNSFFVMRLSESV